VVSGETQVRLSSAKPKIVLGVTVDISLGLMRGLPAFLVERGWDVHIVSSPGPGLDELSDVAGVTIHALPMARNPSPLKDLRALSAWIGLLRRLRPDVISVGTPKAGLLGGIAGSITRVPRRFYLLRGLRLETVHGISFPILWLSERIASASAHRVWAVSASLRDRVVALRLVRPDKVDVLGSGSSNGVSIERFTVTDAARQAAAALLHGRPGPILGFVGRLHADKGFDLLHDALQVLTSRGITGTLLIVGAEDEGGVAASREIEDGGWSVLRSGHVNDLVPYYAAMDLLCLPTYREGFPNVVLEAAVAEVPCVTTDATGAVDAVVDGQTGVVVTGRDPRGYADAIQKCIEDASLRKAYGANARVRAIADFDQAVAWERIRTYYLTATTDG
jgi:glycosyltransferase involved in cell wall biosynthesis